MDRSKNAIALFDKLAKLYESKYMNVDLYREGLDLFCGQIPKKNPEILELACGPGNITKYLLQKRPDFKIFGTDLAPNMIALAKANNPEAEFGLMDCRNIKQLAKKYDGIMCGFALPYLSKEEAIQLIADTANLLHPKGILYLSTMSDDYSKSGIEAASTGDKTFVYYHQADYLTKALEENCFKIILSKYQDYPLKKGITDLIIVAQKE